MSTLVSRNITVNGRRTSIRLEPKMWDALQEVCSREGVSIHQFCTEVEKERSESSLTAAIRVALLSYFRAQVLPTPDNGGRDGALAAARLGAPGPTEPAVADQPMAPLPV